MAFNIPSITDLYNKIKIGIFSKTSGALQVEEDLFVRSISKIQSEELNNAYRVAQDSVAQTFAQNATDEAYLKAIAFDRTNNSIIKLEPTYSTGTLLITASQSTIIESGSQFITSDGEIYQSQVDKTATSQQFIITSLERVSGYAIATLNNHLLGNSMTLTIAGVNETGFNGDQEIEVLSANQFRWASDGVDVEATGTITGTFFGCRVNVTSTTASEDANKTYTDSIDFASSIDFVENVYITYSGIVGGTDEESLDSFKSRILSYLAEPQNKGNRRQHQTWALQKTDANFANFFAYEDDFNLYLVGVISKKDSSFNFSNFTVSELTTIKNLFISQNQLILGIDSLQLSIENPSFVSIDLTISDLSPNTLEMQSEINLVLKEYLSLLPINYLLSSSKVELSSAKIQSIASLARDSNGVTPSFSSISVSNVSSLDANTKKPILGTVTYD